MSICWRRTETNLGLKLLQNHMTWYVRVFSFREELHHILQETKRQLNSGRARLSLVRTTPWACVIINISANNALIPCSNICRASGSMAQTENDQAKYEWRKVKHLLCCLLLLNCSISLIRQAKTGLVGVVIHLRGENCLLGWNSYVGHFITNSWWHTALE